MEDTLTLPQPFEEIAHTADVGLRVQGVDPEETLARLVCAFGRLLAGTDDVPALNTEHIIVPGGELAMTAVDVLREVLYRFHAHQAVPAACRVVRIENEAVEVEVGTAPYDAEAFAEGADVKAVTHHRARFEQDGAGWVAEVVLDI